MNWEARLEDARRRRAIVLAARATVRERPEDPAPAETRRSVADHPRFVPSASRVPEAEPRPRRELRPVLAASAGAALTRLRGGTAALGGAVCIGVSVASRLGALARGGAFRAAVRARERSFRAAEAARRAGPVPVAAGGLAAIAVIAGYLHLTREVAPETFDALSVETLPLPVVAERPGTDWTKPAELSLASLVVEADKLAGLGQPDPGIDGVPMSGPPEPILAAASDAPDGAAESAATKATGEPAIAAEAEAAVPGQAAASVRVFVPADLGGSAGDLARGWVESEGGRVSAVAEVSYRVSATHVRYYHAADQGEAERLATLAGGEARDFTDASPLPGAGYLELYVAGDGIPAPRATRTGAVLAGVEASLANADQEIVRLIEEIFD